MTNELKKTNRVGALLPIFFVVTPALVAMRAYACLKNMDDFGYFSGNLALISNIIFAVFSIIFLTHAFTHQKKDSVPRESFLNYATYIPSGVLAVATAFGIYEISRSFFISYVPGTALNFQKIIKIAAAVLGLCTIASLVINTVTEKRYSQLKGAFSIGAVMFFALYCINIYFDTTTAANSQQKVLAFLSMIFAAVFFLYETRTHLGRPKWHSYVAFGLISAMFSLYTSIPALIYYFSRGNLIPGSTLIELAIILSLGFYVMIRVVLIAYAPEDELCDLALDILNVAHKREDDKVALARVNNNLKEESEG